LSKEICQPLTAGDNIESYKKFSYVGTFFLVSSIIAGGSSPALSSFLPCPNPLMKTCWRYCGLLIVLMILEVIYSI